MLFNMKSSLPLLRRFLQVSLCYIPICEGMDEFKLIVEDGALNQRVKFRLLIPSFGFGSFCAADLNMSNTCPIVYGGEM